MISEGTSSVIELIDPSAHAEVMAVRDAAKKLKQYLLPGSVLHSSSEPCPMCLAVSYWAQVSCLVFGATSYDVATYGFEDLQLYREMESSMEQRTLVEVSAAEPFHGQAVDVLREWEDNFPEPVTPKY